jgi:hypothetical protein
MATLLYICSIQSEDFLQSADFINKIYRLGTNLQIVRNPHFV